MINLFTEEKNYFINLKIFLFIVEFSSWTNNAR